MNVRASVRVFTISITIGLGNLKKNKKKLKTYVQNIQDIR